VGYKRGGVGAAHAMGGLRVGVIQRRVRTRSEGGGLTKVVTIWAVFMSTAYTARLEQATREITLGGRLMGGGGRLDKKELLLARARMLCAGVAAQETRRYLFFFLSLFVSSTYA
jgi:hypothetical protein